MSEHAIELGDVIDVLRDYNDNSFDAVFCDPPYGLSFMNKRWDYDVPSVELWREVFRVCKPGAALLSFGGSRTFHRVTVNIEDAGFEVRDCLTWLYAKGFPKSQNVSKAIDKAAGAERKVIGTRVLTGNAAVSLKDKGGTYGVQVGTVPPKEVPVTAPATELAQQWDGYGTALKPGWEPIVLARKPLDGTMVENVKRWGVGALAIDACRIEAQGRPLIASKAEPSVTAYGNGLNGSRAVGTTDEGRWPANLLLDEEAGALLDETVGNRPSQPYRENTATGAVLPMSKRTAGGFAEKGGPSRFFFSAKVSTKEREAGCDVVERVEFTFRWDNEDRKAVLLVDTAVSPPRVIDVSGMSSSNASEWSTTLFGSGTTVPFRRADKFITRTKTNSTIEAKTWSYLVRWNTSESTADVNCETEYGGSPAPCADNSKSSVESTGTSSESTPLTAGVVPVTCVELFARSKSVEVVISEALPKRTAGEVCERDDDAVGLDSPRARAGRGSGARCHHPTMKPIALCEYLARLIMPPNPGAILVPFAGSGSEMIGALKAGWPAVVGIERESEYVEIAKCRLAHHIKKVA